MPKCDFSKVALHFGMGVSCKFAAYLQNTFCQEHLWRAVSVLVMFSCFVVIFRVLS